MSNEEDMAAAVMEGAGDKSSQQTGKDDQQTVKCVSNDGDVTAQVGDVTTRDGDVTTPAKPPGMGVAYIKPQYIVANIDSSSKDGAVTDKPAEDGSVTHKSDVSNGNSAEKKIDGSAQKRPAEDSLQNEGAKKKKRGQNKNRPKMMREPRNMKLCRDVGSLTKEDRIAPSAGNGAATADSIAATADSIAPSADSIAPSADSIAPSANSIAPSADSITPSADSVAPSTATDNISKGPTKQPEITCGKPWCGFSHDTSQYLANKPPDIGPNCHNYDKFGFCEYGIACRFGSAHIRDGYNIRNDQLWQKTKHTKTQQYILPKSVQVQIRKRDFDFTAAATASKAAYEEKLVSDQEIAAAKAAKNTANGNTVDDKKISDMDTQEDNSNTNGEAKIGPACDDDLIKLRPRERKKIVWKDQLYLAPLTTLGNLPFRRICKRLGADITCGEMAVATNIVRGVPNEWALVKRHHTETVFGVQLCGSNAELMTRAAQLVNHVADIDFVDINVGCPIDFIYKAGAGSGLMRRSSALELMVRGMSRVLPCPVTVKMRTAIHTGDQVAHHLLGRCHRWGASMVALHGRSREQRYTKFADWDYIKRCVADAAPLPLFGNGDVLNYEDYYEKKDQAGVAGIMIGRGALMKPWIFTEIKEKRHWDISSTERYDILKEYTSYGLEHWGCDSEGVERTRRFLLEWLSFLHRYIPIGLLERPPQGINQKPPPYIGRDQLETLMASKNASDWVKISEMLLGKVPEEFVFLPKHRTNSWA